MEISGKKVLVTGGASGLGAAAARHLAEQGAQVTILDFDAEKAAQIAGEIGGFSLQCDVRNEEQVKESLAAATKHFSTSPRIIINCAGIAAGARVVNRDGDLSTALFRKVIEVNLLGSYHVMSYGAAAMMDLPALDNGERGIILNTSSAAYEDGQIGQAAYAASKGGIASMCLPVAREFARSGIRVMAIAPGLFHTPMMEGLPQETVAGITANIPFPNRLGEPSEFGKLAADIIQNSYLNGSVIRLDGAVRLPPK